MFIAPEDRIAAIIKSEPLELEGEAYKGKYELNTKERTTVFKWLRKEFQGKTYINKDTGNRISISRNGLKELVSFIKNDTAYMKSLAHIKEIVENMLYIETMGNIKGSGHANFDYYIIPIKMDGKNYTILSEVGKNANGEYYYYQNVFEGTLTELIEKARGLFNGELTSLANAVEQTSHNKYNKFLEIMQGIYGKNLENNNFLYISKKRHEASQATTKQ